MSFLYIGGARVGNASIRKYDLNGNHIWDADFGGYLLDITADVDGNVYAVGERNSTIGGSATTRKYDADGNLLWSADHGGNVECVAVDNLGNVYTGGTRVGNLTTRKYDANGNLLWSLDHGATVWGIGVDAQGYVYTGGGYPGTSESKFTTRKYDTDGNEVWSVDNTLWPVLDLAVDELGNVYLTKYTTNDDPTVIKRDTNGGLIWGRKNALYCMTIAVDKDGNVITGGAGPTKDICKYDSGGNELWTVHNGSDVYGVAVDAAGNVYIGALNDGGNPPIRSFDADGNLRWNADHGANVTCVAVTPEANGGIPGSTPRGAPVGLPGGGGGGGVLPDWPVDIIDRDGSTPLGYYKLMDIRPTLLTWDAIGGCDRATFRVVAGELDLWQLPDLLRCGISVGDGRGGHVWWGYVHSVDLDLGSYSFGVSLDNLANRIAVAYEYVGSGVNASGTRATTDWAEDEDSIAEFGTFERLESLASADQYDAEARRDALLEVLAWPQPTIDFGDRKLSATIEAYGWHHILKRRYYANTEAVGTMTTDQMADLLAEVGEFFTEVDIAEESGVYSNEFRDGDTNAWEEFRALLESGWTHTDVYTEETPNVRFLCHVTPDRVLRVYREPYPGLSDLRLYPNGVMEDPYGGALPPGLGLVGKWARLVNIVPPQISLQPMVHPTRVFIERVEYDVERMRLRPQPRGLSAYQVGAIQPG